MKIKIEGFEDFIKNMNRKEILIWKRIIYCDHMIKNNKNNYYFKIQIKKSVILLNKL